MSDDLTQRAEPYLRLGSYGVDLIRDLLAEVARLRSMLTALEQEMRKEVEWSAAPARTVVRWANRIAALRETEQPYER